MKTSTANFRKGRLLQGLMVFLLVFLMVATIAPITSYAAGYASIAVKNGVESGSGDEKSLNGTYTTSKDSTVNIGVDRIFWAENFNNITKYVITADNNKNTKVQVTADTKDFKNVSTTISSQKVEITRKRSGWNYLSYTEFNNVVNALNFHYDDTNPELWGGNSVKLTVKLYTSEWWQEVDVTDKYKTYTCTITFADYAQGAINATDENPVQVSYNNKEGDDKYIDGMAVDVNQGEATIPWKFTDFGDAKKVGYGYQIRSSSGTFTEDTPISGFEEMDLTDGEGNMLADEELEKLLNEQRTMSVTGFNANETYYVRLVFTTNDDRYKKLYSDEVAIRYDAPIITSFQLGNTDKVYKGGEDSMNISMAATFNNTNYDNRTYCFNENNELIENCAEEGDKTTHSHAVTGPYMSAKLYYTTNFAKEESIIPDSTDNSTYTQVSDSTTWIEMPGSLDLEKLQLEVDGEISRNYTNSWESFTMPAVDTKNCAFKLVVTDLVTGYEVVKYSNTFTIDTTPPEAPTVSSGGKTDLSPAQAVTAGGAGGVVELTISGAEDPSATEGQEGSGVTEYNYEMYYLDAEAVNSVGQELTIAQVLEAMASLSSTNYGYAEFTPLTSLAIDQTTGAATLTVAKDGYYRVDAYSKDAAGRTSTDFTSAYFRVDLTPPNTPTVYLAQGSSTSLAPYDNRTYSSATVWLLTNTAAMTGKTITKYEFSADGGLTWTDMSTVASTYRLENQSATVYVRGSYSETFSFDYRYAISLSGLLYNDYNSFIVRVTDNLGNVSQVSDAAVMRTIANQPTGGLTMKHEGIEVALAVGNTEMQNTETITAQLKNAAAKKINAQFYGTDHAAYKAISGHTCTWFLEGSTSQVDPAAAGACDASSCPYNNTAYEYFKPEMVNVQGISAADAANQSVFKWVRYDHTMYKYLSDYNNGTTPLPTVSFTSSSVIRTDTRADTTSSKFTYNNKTYYTATTDRVVYTGQNKAFATITAMLAGQEERNGVAEGLTSSTSKTATGASEISFLAKYAAQSQTYIYPVHNWALELKPEYRDYYTNGTSTATQTVAGDPVQDTWTNAGKFIKGLGVGTWHSTNYGGYGYTATSQAIMPRRVYHLVDMSNATTATWYNGYQYKHTDLSKGGNMSVIHGFGYQYGAMRDWLFLYNAQPLKKEIGFTIDDRNCLPHSNDGFGFLFNTTIRQNLSSTWVISGYLFIMGGGETMDTYRWYILKLTDVDLDWFAEGALKNAGNFANYTTNVIGFEDLSVNMINWSATQGNSLTKTMSIQTIAYSMPDTVATSVRNFRLVLDGEKTTLYVYNSQTSVPTAASLSEKFSTELANGISSARFTGPTTNTAATSGYVAVDWQSGVNTNSYIGSTLTTPRPTVDGVAIGSTQAITAQYHTDSNCYGFGPLISGKSSGHGCPRDTLVEFSNITMKMNVARTLAEVVSEPQWGGGKAKYITNIADNSTTDFNDPILTAQVQWRLFNDDAKYIGWGLSSNQAITDDFLDRIEGEGYYEVRTATSRDADIESISTYITEKYYAEYGFDGTSTADPVIEQVANSVTPEMMRKGMTYDLDDMENLTLTVSEYNDSSANPDFPEGRWWIIHDTTGFPGVEKSARSDAWSDALDLKITAAGRWTVYFAPDRGSDGYPINLDPSEAVFNFVVSAKPVAQFTGAIVDGKIQIINSSYDNDTKGSTDKQMGTTSSNSAIQLAGIENVYWRWELLSSRTGSTGEKELITLARSSTGTTFTKQTDAYNDDTIPYDGLTIENLTAGHVETAYQNTSYGASQVGGQWRFTSIPDGAVLTVYQYVEDTSTYVTGYKTDANGSAYTVDNGDGTKSIGQAYYAKPATNATAKSVVCQQNITSGITLDYAPQAAFSLDTVNMYNTANATTSKITVTRQSLQTQGNSEYQEGWAVDLNDGRGYRLLVRATDTNDWYLYPNDRYYNGNTIYTEEQQRNLLPTNSNGEPEASSTTIKNLNGTTLVLDCTTTPKVESGKAVGVWTMGYNFIKTYTTNEKIILRLTESIYGANTTDANGNTVVDTVKDQSARAIYYKTDTNPPTAQSVVGKIYTPDGSGGYTESNYAAGSYLDVSTGAYIQLNVTGSVEREGSLKGYKYYFYDKNSSGTETAYYGHDATTGDIDDSANQTKASATRTLTADESSDVVSLVINASSMKKKPLDSLNVAIYAFDNASPENATTPTRYTDIKLSISEPVPPAISATDSLGDPVTEIGNNYVFYNTTTTDSADDGPVYNSAASTGVKGTDTQSVPENRAYTNSTVTLQFTPKSAKFNLNNAGDYDLSTTGTGTDMYVDAYQKADLTNTALIIYSVEKYNTDEGIYEYYTTTENVSDTETQLVVWKDREISANRTLSLSEDGTYRVSAKVRNGAGTLSKERVIEFTIDKQSPSAIPQNGVTIKTGEGADYTSDKWTSSLVLSFTGSTDANGTTAVYEYSIDNGATWYVCGEGLGSSGIVTFPNSSDFATPLVGEFNVLIRAKDLAGNTSTSLERTVKIDTVAPNVSAPTLTASSSLRKHYTEYTVSVVKPTGGNVYAINDGQINTEDLSTEFAAPAYGQLLFNIIPTEGNELDTVLLNGSVVEKNTDSLYEADEESGLSGWILVTPELDRDFTLEARFISSDSAEQASYKAFESAAMTTRAINYAVQTLSADLLADEGATEEGSADEGTNEGTGEEEGNEGEEPTPTPEPEATPTPEPEATPTPEPEATPTPEPEATPTPEPEPEPEPEPAQTYTVSVVSTADSIYGTLSGKVGNDDLHDTYSSSEVPANSICSIVITPIRGYDLEYLSISSVQIKPGDPGLTYDEKTATYSYDSFEITQDTTIRVAFKQLTIRQVQVTSGIGGSVSVSGSAFSRDLGNGFYEAYVDRNLDITITPKTGYQVDSLIIDGVNQLENPSSSPYTYSYTIPAGEDTEAPIEISAEFGVSTTSTPAEIEVLITRGKGTVEGIEGADEGTTGILTVPQGLSHTVRIYPAENYEISEAYATSWSVLDEEYVSSNVKEKLKELTDEDGNVYYEYTFDNVMYDGNKLDIAFTLHTYSVQLSTVNATGGTLTLSGWTGSRDAIPVGTVVTVNAANAADYRVGQMKVNGKVIGTVKSYSFAVFEDTSIEVEFLSRGVEQEEIVHSINVVANNISDTHDSLNPIPYQFRIRKSSDPAFTDPEAGWSGWQVANTINFSELADGAELEANTEYVVEVRARDNVGNAATASATIHTLANAPYAEAAESANLENESATNKAAIVVVSPEGNPVAGKGLEKGTEYRVYYSTYSNMTSLQTANYAEGNPELDGWEELTYNEEKDRYEFTVTGLAAGLRYYMQVVAKNEDGIQTALNSQNIVSVQLTSEAPPENTLYASNQAGPLGDVTLTWVNVPTDIEEIELYRDGVPFARVNAAEVASLSDKAVDIIADEVVTYSYAYINDAGAGSRRTAVTEEYYEAVTKSSTDSAMLDKLDNMDKLAELDNEKDKDLFTQVLTYPTYPKITSSTGDNRIVRVRAGVESTDPYSGYIVARVNYDPVTTGRPQKYKLGLYAYEYNSETGGYDAVDGWDPEEHITYTTTTDASGAVARWTGLYVNYEYRACILEIYTTGVQEVNADSGAVTDGYFAYTSGLEGYLGKRYIVDGTGYRSEFKNAADTIEVVGTKLYSESGEWDTTTGELLQYTDGTNWGDPIGVYFKFNKSPEIALAPTDTYADSNLITDTEAGNYVLIDLENNAPLKLNTIAWDPDGTANEQKATANIRAEIQGIANASITKIPSSRLPKDETTAKITDNYFLLELPVNADQAATGLTTGIKLSVDDGEINKEITAPIRLVTNYSVPSITTDVKGGSSGSSVYRIEAGATYSQSLLTINTALSGDKGVLRPVRLLVMADTYNTKFGSHTESGIEAKLSSGDATARASALQLLGEATYNKYLAAGDFKSMATDAIDAVNPPYQAYVQITEEQFNAIPAEDADKKYTRTSGGVTTYWAEVQHALDNNLCTWFTRAEEGEGYTVSADALNQTNQLLVVASFGNNTNSTPLYFTAVNSSSMTIKSDQTWGWVEVDKDEYDIFSTGTNLVGAPYTIGKLYDRISALYPSGTCPPLVLAEGETKDDWAFKQEGDKYYVYKIIDKNMEIYSDEISGWVTVTTGVYTQFERGYVLATTNPVRPSEAAVLDLTLLKSECGDKSTRMDVRDPNNTQSGDKLTGQGVDYSFSGGGLTDNLTYYLWTAYIYEDLITGDDVVVVSEGDAIVVTTEVDYDLSRYGFSSSKWYETLYENKLNIAGYPVGTTNYVDVTRTGDTSATSAKMGVSVEFYEADQFGNILTEMVDGVEVEKKLEGDYRKAAEKVFSFSSGEPGDLDYEFNSENRTSYPIPFYLWQNGKEQQKHMVVRMTLSVLDQTTESGYKPYNRVKESAESFDIFIIDDDSPVTRYKVDVDNRADSLGNTLTEVWKADGTLDYYEYKFSGLQVDYSSPEMRTVYLKNGSDPEGELTDISATIYTSRDKTEESGDFIFSLNPSKTLVAPQIDSLAETRFQVSAKYGLEDGVHEAWICVTDKNVLKEDEVWIKLVQVVGQSTLSGRVYYTETAPDNNYTWVGSSTVSLYDGEGYIDATGQLKRDLLYQTKTDEWGGYFEIPNIINGKKYYLVVERNGYITYDAIFADDMDDSSTADYFFTTDEESRDYELYLQLRGGDANNDKIINMEDYDLINKYFNNYYGGDAAKDWDEEFYKGCVAADFNSDEIVNIFDRMIFWDSYALRIDNDYNLGDEDNLYRSGAYQYLLPKDRIREVQEVQTGE